MLIHQSIKFSFDHLDFMGLTYNILKCRISQNKEMQENVPPIYYKKKNVCNLSQEACGFTSLYFQVQGLFYYFF